MPILPVDVIYYECDCGFKGTVPWTMLAYVCKRVCPKCGKAIPMSEEEKARGRFT